MNKIFSPSVTCAVLTVFFALHSAIDSSQLLKEVYVGIDGFSVGQGEYAKIEQEGGAPTYGEITYDAVKQLLNDLKLNSRDVFYDLGSGVGKFAMHVYLDTPVKKSVGVELSETRDARAKSAHKKLSEKKIRLPGKKLEYRNENIFSTDIADATVVYLASTCFSDDMMDKIGKRLSHLKKGLRVITLRRFAHPEKYNLVFVRDWSLPMTWSTNVSVHMYELKK